MPRKPLSPARRKALSDRMKRRMNGRISKHLADSEMRALIARALRDGASSTDVAKQLGIPRRQVDEYVERSLARIGDPDVQWRGDPYDPRDRPRRPFKRGDGPGPHVKGSPKGADPQVFDGEILDPPEEIQFRRDAFQLRKRGISVTEIAEELGRKPEDVNKAVRAYLQDLERNEIQDMALHKRMMLEQIDAMIAAITVPATGRDIDGKPAKVILEAIDRMVRLLDQKAKLLGLNTPQRLDITHRIEALAEETEYDVEELREIAYEVIRGYATRTIGGG